MTDFILPTDLVASDVEWTIFDNSAVFQSPLSGAVRTVSRPGNRWGVRAIYRAVSGQKRRRLLSIIAALRGRSNRLYFTDPSYTLAGSLSCPELLSNNAATVNTTGWTSSNAELEISADSHFGLRLFRAGVTADRYVYQAAATTVTSAPYAVRMLLYAGRGNARASIEAGTTQGATDVLNGATRSADGYYVDSFAASGTSTHFSFYDYISGRSAGNFQFLPWVSAARCVLVNGSSQTGNKLIVDGLPTSTNGVARAGDWFEVNGELKRLTADLNSDGSGNGYMIFEPSLRASPANNAPVIFRSPMGKFLFAEDSVSYDTRPGIISDIELNLVEDVT
jgi:hypothetical protein